MNIKLFTYLLITQLLIKLGSCEQPVNNVNDHLNSAAELYTAESQMPYPHIIYMTPKEPSELTINERNSFTQELNTGWIMKGDAKVDFLFYLFVEEKIVSLEEIGNSYVYFTTSKNECNADNEYTVYNENEKIADDANLIFKLEFLGERSKLYQSQDSYAKRMTKKHRIMSRSVDNGIEKDRINSTLLVAHSTIKLSYNPKKYYVCVHFEKKESKYSSANNPFKFVHQGGRNVWSSIITTKDMLPIYMVVIFYLILLMFSSLCSGLNLG